MRQSGGGAEEPSVARTGRPVGGLITHVVSSDGYKSPGIIPGVSEQNRSADRFSHHSQPATQRQHENESV